MSRARVRDDVHAVDVPLLVADQQRIAVELRAGFVQARIERGAHQAAAERDGELPAAAVALAGGRPASRSACARAPVANTR